MIIKKFTGKNEEEAVKAAKAELGSNAVVMNVRTVKRKGLFGFFKKPMTEVTAAVEEEKDAVISQTKPVPKPLNLSQAQGMQSLKNAQELHPKGMLRDIIDDDKDEASAGDKGEGEDNIAQKLESIHSLIEQQLKSAKEIQDEEVSDENASKNDGDNTVISFMKLIYNTLIENEVNEKYANGIIDDASKLNRPGVSIDYLLSSIYQKLILKFGQPREIEPATEGARIVFFIGPTGVGKTTTIAKIASRLCVAEKKKVALVTTDTYRIKAAEQLRTYADILEVPFRIAYNVDDLNGAFADLKEYDYILVDTAGYSPHDEEKREEMKVFLNAAKKNAQIETYLVLSVTTKYHDLLTIADLYKEMADYRLIFTKLDETDTYGNILNLRLHTGADISYVTDGQDVPDDIEVFNPQAIVKTILGGKSENGEI